MTTTSYPAVGNNGLTEAQWAIMYGSRDAIVEDYQGNACNLTRINAGDLCRIAVGRVSVNGYVLDVTAAEDLYCAPVPSGGQPVTYWIVAQYDPTLNVAQGPTDPVPGNRSDAGPCRLLLVTTLTTTAGRVNLPLFKIIRNPNQQLTAAALTDLRRWTGPRVEQPSYSVATTADFPRGTMLIQSGIGEWSVRTSDSTSDSLVWRSMTHGAIKDLPISSYWVAHDTSPTYEVANGRVYIEGSIKRFAATLDIPQGNTQVCVLPEGARPDGIVRFVIVLLGTNSVYGNITILTNGVVNLYCPVAASVADLAGIDFRQGN